MIIDKDNLLLDLFNRLFDNESKFTIQNQEFDVKQLYSKICEIDLHPEQKIYLNQNGHKYVFYFCKEKYQVRNVIDNRHFSDVYNQTRYFRQNYKNIKYLVSTICREGDYYYYLRLNKLPYEDNELRFNIDRSKRIQTPRNSEYIWREN